MRKLEHFDKKRGYAVLRPVGAIPFDQVVELTSRAVRLCREQKIEKLLVGADGICLLFFLGAALRAECRLDNDEPTRAESGAPIFGSRRML